MSWSQGYEPLDNQALSTIVTALVGTQVYFPAVRIAARALIVSIVAGLW